MFLAAAPYFHSRFADSDWISTHFQSSIMSVSTVTNLGFIVILTKLQRNASYPKRVVAALIINIVAFTLLAISALFYRGISAGTYFGFVLVMVLLSSLSAGLCQNGLFAFVSGFGEPTYTQGIMTGQGIAGVLPCIVQILSVLSVPEHHAEEGAGQESPKSAFAYFMTATVVSTAALIAFLYLARRHPDESTTKKTLDNVEEVEDAGLLERKTVGLFLLFRKLTWFALGVTITFAVSMFFPVFTATILSVRPVESAPRLLQPACFIPLGFLFWNGGDLLGRIMPSIPGMSAIKAPRFVFLASLSRVAFIPLYLLCNIRGRGAAIPSDAFYLLVVQLLFGVSNGFLGSTCMMAAPEWVEEGEREAAGGFMGLMLVSGLTIGSLLSFAVAKA